jgi:hypothetical protein
MTVRRSGSQTQGTTQTPILGTTQGTNQQSPINTSGTTSGTTRNHPTAGKGVSPLPLGGTTPADPQGSQNSRASDYDLEDFPRGDPQTHVLGADDLEAGGGLLQALVESQPSWRRKALCRSQPLAIFFPIRGQSNKPGLAVCGPCSVRPECLAEAIAESLEHGIRGGLTGQARIAARKAQATDDTEQAA